MSVGSDFGSTKRRQSFSWLRLLTVILLLLSAVFIAKFYVAHHKKVGQPKHIALKTVALPAAPQVVAPQYDFYQSLQKVQVHPTTQPIPLADPDTDAREFWVQVAASSSLDAIKRKMHELISAGYIASISKPTGTSRLYRIVLGPYHASGLANVALKRLRVSGGNGYIFSKSIDNKT
jgi:cell division septation protein DedD